MRLSAYIMVADPAWIEASVLSYYDLVDRIVVSYDECGRGYTGVTVAIDECVRRLRAIDRDGKCRYSPGHYARPDRKPGENETRQRQCALDEAGDGADWVLQLDTDEVLGDPGKFHSCLLEADRRGFGGMDYPARWLYQSIGNGRYLEACSRFWRITASYPGPVAVKSGTSLSRARTCDRRLFRVDFRPINTDPWHPKETPVHRVVGENQGIFHLTMVRSEVEMQQKIASWGDPKSSDSERQLQCWAWCGRHPHLAAALSPFVRRRHRNQLRLVTIEIHPA